MKKSWKVIGLATSIIGVSLVGLDFALSNNYMRAAKLCVGTGICRHTAAFSGTGWSSDRLPSELFKVLRSKQAEPAFGIKQNTLLITYRVGAERFLQACPLVRTDKGYRPSATELFLATMRALAHVEKPDLSTLAEQRDTVAKKSSEYFSILEQSCGGKVVVSSGKAVSREEFLGDLAKLTEVAREFGGSVRHFQLTGSE